MKKTVLQICSVIGLVILMAVVSTPAQTQYRAHIPFDFTIGQKSYKAGGYFVGMLNSDTAHKIILIRDAKGRSVYMTAGRPGEDYSKVKIAELVFNRYATQYSLAVIRTPSFIAELPKSKANGSLARSQNVQQNVVVLIKKN